MRIVRPKEFQARLGIGRSAFYNGMISGWIRRPFVIAPGGKAVGWTDDYVDEVIAERAASGEGDVVARPVRKAG
jgi:predicted DNA-binding transcriptional regulator AlpA